MVATEPSKKCDFCNFYHKTIHNSRSYQHITQAKRHTFKEHAGVHLGGVELVRLGAGVALLPHEHVLLDVSLPDVGHRVDDVRQLQLPQRRNLVIREQSVLLVLKPEPVIIIIIIIIIIVIIIITCPRLGASRTAP